MFYIWGSLLHLREICSVEWERIKKGKKGEENEGEKRTSSSLIYEQRSCSSEQIYASRGRGSLLLWLIFISKP